MAPKKPATAERMAARMERLQNLSPAEIRAHITETLRIPEVRGRSPGFGEVRLGAGALLPECSPARPGDLDHS